MTEQELNKEIQDKIDDLEIRIHAGEKILKQCQTQLRTLKLRAKHLLKLKQEVKIVSASDGDL